MNRAVPPGSGGARATVIIPARNAADTIEETIASVRAQTCPDWQAIVVDDGSTDETAAIVERLAANDPRIRVVSGPGRGPGAARNVGVSVATTPLISFLDADDLLAPLFLERMLAPFEAAPDVAGAYTDWLRLSPDGTTEQGPSPAVDGDLFDLFAAACVFPLHACVIRRIEVDEAGGFDDAPTTIFAEDWDLWQRIARTGARFAHVEGPLVVYRMRSGSRSRNSRRVLGDGLAVIARGHAPDPRVRRPHPAHEGGRDRSLLARASYNHLSWAAGMALASGEDPVPLLEALAGVEAPDLDPLEVGGTMLEAMRVTSCVPPSAGLSVVAELADGVIDFLRALEQAAAAPDLAVRVARAVDRLISQQDLSPRPRTLLVTHEVEVELAQPLTDVTDLLARLDRFSAALTYAGAPLGEIELPVCDRRVPSWLIADAAADAAGWQLLERFLSHCVYPASEKHAVVFDPSSWAVLVQELFGMRGETLSRIYEPAPAADGTAPAADPVLEIDVSDPLRDVRVDAEWARVRCTIGGGLFGDVLVPTVDGVLTPGSVRRAFADTRPNELVRLVAREGIIGWPADSVDPLRERLGQRRAAGASLERALPHGGIALFRHADVPIGAPGARPALLPGAAIGSIERLALATGASIAIVPSDRGLAGSSGAAYWPDRAQPPIAPPPSMANLSGERLSKGNESGAGLNPDGLLVLAYDRIHPDRDAPDRVVHPRDFEAQLAHLRALGYRSVSQDEWKAMFDSGEPVSRRRVLLTFDGGYADFTDHAWPVLARYGFNALVFLVTGAIGGTSRWDAPRRQSAPLMDWATIRALHLQGVWFGSGSMSHPRLSGRQMESVVSEVFDSRAEIASSVGGSATCFAYPYGEDDLALRRIVGAAGYRFAFSRRPARWTNDDHPLAVPRRVVAQTRSLDDLVA